MRSILRLFAGVLALLVSLAGTSAYGQGGATGAISGVVGFLGALDTGTVGDAVLGVALLAFGVAFPQIVLRVFRRY